MPEYGELYPKPENSTQVLLAMLVTFCKSARRPYDGHPVM